MRPLRDTFLRPEDFDDPEELQADPADTRLRRVVITAGLAVLVGAVGFGVWWS